MEEPCCMPRNVTKKCATERGDAVPNRAVRVSHMALHTAGLKNCGSPIQDDNVGRGRKPGDCIGDGLQAGHDSRKLNGATASYWCQAEKDTDVSGAVMGSKTISGWGGRQISWHDSWKRHRGNYQEASASVGGYGDNDNAEFAACNSRISPTEHLPAGGNASSKTTKAPTPQVQLVEYEDDYGDDESEQVAIPRSRSKTPITKGSQPNVTWKKNARPLPSAVTDSMQRHHTILQDKANRDYDDSVSIVVSKTNFNVSRQSLIKYSEYFQSIKNIANVDCIKLDLDLGLAAFAVVHEWLMGNCGVALDATNVVEVFDAARKLGITKLANQCHDFIHDYLRTAKNDPLPLFEHVRTIGDDDLFHEVHEQVAKKANAIFRAPYFLAYTVHQVCLLLSDDFICIPREKAVFDAAVCWLSYDWERRRAHTGRVMACVRLGLMDEDELLVCAIDDKAGLILEEPECQDMLLKAFQYSAAVDLGCEVSVPHLAPPPRMGKGFEEFADTESFSPGSWTGHPGFVMQRLEPPKASTITLGSKIPPARSMRQRSQLKAGQDDPKEGRFWLDAEKESATRIQNWWRRRINRYGYNGDGSLTESFVERDEKRDSKVAADGDNFPSCICLPGIDAILVFGGIQHNTNERSILRLNPLGSEWHRVGTMAVKLVGFRIALLDKFIYVVGGALLNGKKKLVAQNAVWRLDVQSNTWSPAKAMHKSRMDHVVVTYKKRLYAIGGRDQKGRLMSSMECYYQDSDAWFGAAPVPHAKGAMAGILFRDHVWLCGGIGITKKSRQRIVSSSVDCYDPLRDYWYRQTPLPMAVCHSAIAVCGGSLYVIGGLTRILDDERASSIREKGVNNMFAFDAIEDRWMELKKLKYPRWKATATATGTNIYVIGGTSGACSVERYDEKNNRWTDGPSLPDAVSDGDSLLLPMERSYSSSQL